MPPREVVVKVSLEGLVDASNSAKGFAGDIASVGTAATEATAAAAPLGATVDKTAASLKSASTTGIELSGTLRDKIGPAAEAAFQAFDKLSKVEGVRGLAQGLAVATVTTQQFKAAVEAAQASGEKMPPAIGQALKAMGSDIANATQKLGDLRKAQIDVGAEAGLAGNKLDSLRNAAGSLDGAFREMDRTGTGLVKTFGQFGLGAGIAVLGFELLKKVGEEVGKAIDYQAQKMQLLADTEAKGRNDALLFEAANRALNQGLIANSDSVAGLVANYELYILASGRGSDAAKKAALGFTDAQMAALNYGAETAKAEALSAALEGQFKNTAAATEDVAKKTTALTLERQKNDVALAAGNVTGAAANDILYREALASGALVTAQAKASSEQFKSNQMIQAAEPLLRKTEAAYRSMGEAVPASVRAAIDALDALKKKQDDATAAMQRAMVVAKDIPASMQRQIDESKKLADATKLVADAHDKLIPSLVKILDDLRTGKITTAEATAELTAYATANKLTVPEVMKMVTEQGNLSEKLEKTDAAFASQIGNLGDAATKMGTFAEKTKDAAAALRDVNAEWDRNVAIVRARNAAIDAAVAAEPKMVNSFFQTLSALLVLAPATKAATDALMDMLKAQNLYTASLEHTLSVATGWSDYLANLKQSYDQGVTSILQYKLALEQFLHTLETQFSTATGKAKASLEEMIAVVTKLINTAGAGGPQNIDYTAGGALNRALNP